MSINSIRDKRKADLTARQCESIKADAKIREYPDGHSRLVLRVTPSGVKTWTMRYRSADGRQRRYNIGNFKSMSLKEARIAYAEIELAIKKGIDPSLERQKARIAAAELAGVQNLNKVADMYFTACEAGKHKKRVPSPKKAETIRDERSSFDNHIAPLLGKFDLDQISRGMVQAMIDGIEKLHKPGTARAAKKTLHSIYSFAIWKEITTRVNPCRDVVYPESQMRTRELTQDEMRALWHHYTIPLTSPKPKISAALAIAIKLCLVLGQRSGEIAQMSESDIDWEISAWTIPATKNGRPHIVPLPPLAIELIQEAMALRTKASKYVFPSPRNAKKPIGRRAVSGAFQRTKDAFQSDFTLHDSRRTFATNLAKPPISAPEFLISKLLNHTVQQSPESGARITRTYNLWAYFPEKSDLMAQWDRRLREILQSNLPDAKVVKLHAA